MNCKLDRSLTEGRLIRDVGPNKMMTLISYKLNKEMKLILDNTRVRLFKVITGLT